MTRSRWWTALAALLVLAWLGADHLVTGPGLLAASEAEAERPEDPAAAMAAYGEPSPPSATALYNLGVLHYRLQDRARALAYWRAAWELRPRSADLAHNIAVVRSELPDGRPPPAPFAAGWMALLNPAELAVFALLCWLASARWLALRHDEEHPLPVGVALVVLATGLSYAAWQGAAALQSQPPAVLTEQAAARDAPAFEGKERFVLPMGSEVRAHARQRGFVLVEDGLGRRGWVVSTLLALPGPGAP
jgi:hypothetical protein